MKSFCLVGSINNSEYFFIADIVSNLLFIEFAPSFFTKLIFFDSENADTL